MIRFEGCCVQIFIFWMATYLIIFEEELFSFVLGNTHEELILLTDILQSEFFVRQLIYFKILVEMSQMSTSN